MDDIRYLCRRGERFYFRRRVPRLSTYLSPVLVSLGTTDRVLARKMCVQLTARMDRMLDENLHEALPERDVAAFFKAELQAVLAGLRQVRSIERLDGSLTEDKARRNSLETFVLKGMVEDGLREDMPKARLDSLPPEERVIAQDIHARTYREFLSKGFNQQIQTRAGLDADATQLEKLQIRGAAIEARMAAHEAVENVPLHNGEASARAAVELLAQIMRAAADARVTVPAKQADAAVPVFTRSEPSSRAGSPVVQEKASSSTADAITAACPALQDESVLPVANTKPASTTAQKACGFTPGVTEIEEQMTGAAVLAQLDEAERQPEDGGFDGSAGSAMAERTFGDDLAGTAVRMNRRSHSKSDTKAQKVKSIALFMFLTGVQRVGQIRQHHVDQFASLMTHRMPKHYWKSQSDMSLTSTELMRSGKATGKPVGLSSATISRHLITIAAVIRHGRSEGNVGAFEPNLTGLVPPDDRTDAEKREVFTVEELRKLFAHPLWSGCRGRGSRHTRGTKIFKDHHFWINLILAYTGARRSEVAGVLVTDVGNEDGIPFIDIRGNHLRGLKNRDSKRRIPLHPDLIEAGFLDFVEDCKAKGMLALFEAAVPHHVRHIAHAPNHPEAHYDKKFGDVLDHMLRVSLEKSLRGNPRGLSAHGMRHFLNDHLLNLRGEDGVTALVSDMDRRDLMGHAPRDVNTASYRRAEKPLGPLYAAIKTIPSLIDL